MSKIYLDNAKQLFLKPPKDDYYYEGRSCEELDAFFEMLGYIIPNKVDSEALIVYIKLLIKDINNRKCGFQNSKAFKQIFNKQIVLFDNIEFYLTYVPSFIEAVAPKDFYQEFIVLFKKVFYQLENKKQEVEYECIEIEPNHIDISNKNKADVLANLYNLAKPVGMGILQYDPTPMTRKDAQYVLDHYGYSFDYLLGRPLKINLEPDIIWVANYNRDNNQDDLAQIAISMCPNVKGSSKIKKL